MLLLLAMACAARLPTAPVSVPVPSQDAVRIVFLGDSGYLPDGTACTWRDDGSAAADCHITADERARLRAAIQAQAPDYVYGLGDLSYPVGPACREPVGEAQAALDAKIGAVYGGLGGQSFLVLGNHDVGHLGRGPKRERCLKAWADVQDDIALPALQYVVDHGPVTVVVPNSNLRRRKKLPGAELQAAVAGPDPVIVAAHHELRVAFEKHGQHPLEPPPMGEWLSDLGVAPDLWLNGHAHTLEVGTYDARVVDDGRVDRDDPATPLPVLAVTSGAGSKLRAHPSCPGDPACAVGEPRGMPDFARSRFGFVVVDADADGLVLRVLDLDGVALHRVELPGPQAQDRPASRARDRVAPTD